MKTLLKSNSGQLKSSLVKQIEVHRQKLKAASGEEKQRIKTNLRLLQDEMKKLKSKLG